MKEGESVKHYLMVRNAKDDLALCDKATPGPWTEEPSGEKVGGFSCDVAIAATQGRQKIYARPRGGTFPYNDKRFIAMAREALPYWIKRAERLGCALRLACEMVASCTDCPGAQDDWPGCGGTAEKCSDDEPDCWKRYFLEEGGQGR